MRIMYLTESMRWSGGAPQLLQIAQGLKARGHPLILACQPGSDISERAQAEGLDTRRVAVPA